MLVQILHLQTCPRVTFGEKFEFKFTGWAILDKQPEIDSNVYQKFEHWAVLSSWFFTFAQKKNLEKYYTDAWLHV